MPKRLITAALLTAAVAFPATADVKHGKIVKHGKQEQIVNSLEVTMPDGTTATVYVVKVKHKGVWTRFSALQSHVAPRASHANTVVMANSVRANTMIAAPEDRTPDPLHQRLFTVRH
jgi:hypothetical protein